MEQYCPHCMRPTQGSVCGFCGKPTAYAAPSHHLRPGPFPELVDEELSYYLGAALGQGGFGITYLALENFGPLHSSERVAIKEFYPMLCCYRQGARVIPKPGKEEAFRGGLRRFLEEARLLHSQLGNPGVVQVRRFFEANGTAYIVMEYLDGVTLKQKVMKDGPIPPRTLLPKLPPLLRAMERCHAAGIVHRDIGPDNIMLMPDGTLKLLDFGSAKIIEKDKSVTINFKPGFSPVEQYLTRGEQGPWTDVYALCASIYYCLTRVVPPSAPERLEHDTLAPLSALGVKLPSYQEAAILAGLAVQPQNRLQSIQTLADRLAIREQPDGGLLPRCRAWLERHKRPVLAAVIGIAALIALIQAEAEPAVIACVALTGVLLYRHLKK